jgi:hypothetical protein
VFHWHSLIHLCVIEPFTHSPTLSSLNTNSLSHSRRPAYFRTCCTKQLRACSESTVESSDKRALICMVRNKMKLIMQVHKKNKLIMKALNNKNRQNNTHHLFLIQSNALKINFQIIRLFAVNCTNCFSSDCHGPLQLQ